MKKIYATLIFLIASLFSFACDNSIFTLTNQTANPDGSITYTFNVNIDLGSLDATFYGFTISFNSLVSSPQVILAGTYPTTTSITDANLSCGTLNGATLTALTGANINSINNDSDWSPYVGLNNVISFEDGTTFGSANSDICMTLQITVMGCVENIELNANVNNGGLCLYSVSTGQNCTLGIPELIKVDKKIVKIIDLMGREVEYSPNTPVIFIFSDGTRERAMKIEE
jgi:hypothetical protein